MNRFLARAMSVALIAAPGLALAQGGWTGFYVGGHIAATDTEVSFAGPGTSENSTGFGLHAGYNHNLNDRFVLGGELSRGKLEYSDLAFDEDLTSERVKIRLGYTTGSALFYGVAGYARISDSDEDEDGHTLGLGVDYKLTSNVLLGAELLYDSFSAEGIDLDVTSLSFRVSYRF
jgi:opacity protein-like surface antigen